MASSLLLLLLLFLFFFFFFSLSSAVPQEAILDASDILSDSGFISMALTLEVVADTPLLQPPSLTIFAPSDSAFRKYGQPSLDLLRFHFVPTPLPAQSLRLLPSGSKIPTMFDEHSLVVTTPPSDQRISLNTVWINVSPIYDDGSVLIYGIDRFFDPNFHYNGQLERPSEKPSCPVNNRTVSPSNSLNRALKGLKSGGYSVMASFLGMQLSSIEETPITILAPPDDMVANRLGNFSDYPSFFLRHVLPCKLLWNDLVDINDDGFELPTYLNGISINVTRSSSGVLMLNGVQVFFPDLFYSDDFVVHGVNDVLPANGKPQEAAESEFDPDEF